MEVWSNVFTVALFSATIRSATPILFPGPGRDLSERSGVLNIALEGIMLISAFAAVVGSYYTGNAWIGVLCAVAAGVLTSLIHAFMCINLRADQAIVGTGINILGAGLPSFLLLKLFGSQGISPIVERIYEVRVPILADIPIIGPVLGMQSPLVSISLLMVPVGFFVLFRTPFGLRLRSVGENPHASETDRDQRLPNALSGRDYQWCAGCSGRGILSVSYLAQFVKLMTAGRGFIGLSAMIFGRWNPWGALFACLLFGFADALQAAAQASNVPRLRLPLLRMLPYVLTIIALVGAMGRAEPPAYVAKPYEKA